MIAASEVLAITELFKFRFQPEYLQSHGYPQDHVEWRGGLDTHSAIWVGLFLVIILLVNLLPVLQYGRVEYVIGCLKIIFVVGLIMFNTILNARKKFHSTRFWTYDDPYSFATKSFIVKTFADGSPRITLTGALGGLASFWTAMSTTLFSLTGWEMVLWAAPECKEMHKTETTKMTTRKISIRVILLYSLAAFTVGLNVPYDDENLRDLTLLSVKGGQNSVFVIACIRENVKFFPHFFTGFFIFSACSTGINCLYGASRALHALASIRDCWPSNAVFESIRSRLERTRHGVPMNAVFTSWLVALVAFLATTAKPDDTLGRMTSVAVTAGLIVYAVNCLAYLNFYRQVNAAARGDLDDDLNLTQETRTFYKRAARQYPYRSHLQWIRAVYAFVGCTLMIIFQGWHTFLSPMKTAEFVAIYIGIIIFIVLSMAYCIKNRGFSPRNWRTFAIGLSGLGTVGPVVVSADSINTPCAFCKAKHRRGHLHFPDSGLFSKNNARALGEWIWAWLK
jgi:amino acid transporter